MNTHIKSDMLSRGSRISTELWIIFCRLPCERSLSFSGDPQGKFLDDSQAGIYNTCC